MTAKIKVNPIQLTELIRSSVRLAVDFAVSARQDTWLGGVQLIIKAHYGPSRPTEIIGPWIDGPVCDLFDVICEGVTIEDDPSAFEPNGEATAVLLHFGAPSAHEIIAATELLTETLGRMGLPESRIARLLDLRER